MWSLGDDVSLGRPLARLYEPARLQFSSDEKYIYGFDSRNIYLGHSDDVLSIVAFINSLVQAIATTPDYSRLIFLPKKELFIVRRSVYLWDIALWELKWPPLTKPIYLARERPQ